MRNETNYIVAGCKPWNRRVFDKVIAKYPGKWHFFSSPDELKPDSIAAIAPRYIFFLHWSWKVPQEIINSYECVCFHMTDLPYGRGGSPLQNLIVRGHRSTKLTAFCIIEDLDAGPVYAKEYLSLEGNAEEIYIRASYLSAQMIRQIIEKEPTPQAQIGDAVIFERRKPAQSRITELPNLQALHDFIRMLDAEGYPRAFIQHARFRYEFSRASLRDGHILADVRIIPIEDKNS